MRKLRLPRKITQRWIATVQFLAATPETHCFPVVLLEPRCVSAPFGSFPRARNPPLETRGMCTEFAGDHGLPRDPGIHLKTGGKRGVWRDPGNAPGKPRGFTEFPCGSVVSQPVLTGSSTVSFRADQKGASNGAQQVASQGYHNPDDVAAKGTDPCADESRSDAVTYDVAAENHRARHPPSLERLCPRRRRRI